MRLHTTQVTCIRRVRPAYEVQNSPPARAPLNPHLSASGELQGCSPARHTTPRETEKAATNLVRVVPAAVVVLKKNVLKKITESDHVTVRSRDSQSLSSRYFWGSEFLSVVLMDMPKVASVIGLLSSDESSDCNQAMTVRKKQRVRQHSSTTFQLKWSKTWPCIQPLKTDPSRRHAQYDFPHICINITSMIFPGITKKGLNAFNCNCVSYVEYRAQ